MKNKITWFSAILLLVTLSITKNSLSQEAFSCDSAKAFTYPINSTVSNYTNSVYWFKVNLNEGDFDIKIENLPGVGKIMSAEVYTGTCSALSLQRVDSIATPGDTTFHITIHNTSPAVTYYVKLNNRGGNVSFNKTMATTVQIVGQVAFCPGQQITLSAYVLNVGSNPAYAWSSGGGTGINSNPFSPISSTNYSLVYTDASGANITANITVFPLGPNECKNCEYTQNGHFEWYNANTVIVNNINYTIITPQFFINPNTNASPDYLNSFGGIPLTPIPHSGNAYGGIFTYYNSSNSYREYLQNQLKCQLVVGQKYEVSFFAKLNGGPSNKASNIGAYLSTGPIISNITPVNNLNFIPQINWTTPINNSSNWTQVIGIINGNNQQYITIGNFHDNLSSTLVNSTNPPTNPIGVDNAYYYIDDISVIPVPPTISSSAITVDCHTIGSTIVLTANGSPSAYTSWSDGTNTYAGSIVTVPKPNTTTTYYCTVTLPCSSCAPMVQQITVNVINNGPAVSISAAPTTPCIGQAVTLTPSGAQTYVLQGTGLPANGLTSSGAPFTVNPFATTTYVLTGTAANGCTGTTQITITPTGFGATCINDHTSGTNITIPLGTTFNTINGTYTGYNFTCYGDINIPANLTTNFNNCTFMMGPGSQISLQMKSNLRIDNSHLYGCTSMWEGIRMKGQVGGNVTLTNTVLEDAYWGIWAPAAGTTGAQNFPNKIKVVNCLFNTNYIDIYYNNNTTNTIDVSKTLFTSRCLNYDPPFSVLPPNVTDINTVITPIVQPAPFIMPLTYISGGNTTNIANPYVGLELTRFSSNNNPASGNQITLTTTNIFDYHAIGIETLNFSNLKIEKQIFANGLGDAFNNKLYGYGSIGILAHNINWTAVNNAYIGNVAIGGSAAKTNTFTTLDYGIYAQGGGTADSRFTIRNNDFRKIRANGVTFYSYGSLVNNVPTRIIQNNTFKEINAWGIYMLNSVTTYGLIGNNSFVNPATPVLYTPYGGIYIGEIKNPTTAKYFVNSNTMSQMVNGIRCENLAQLSSSYNTIQLSPQTNIITNRGYHLINCLKPNILRNDITGNTTPSNINPDLGMYVLDCNSGSYTCNTFKNTLIGSSFSGQNVSTTLFENTYDYNLAGIHLTNQGFIDIQDDPNFPGEPVDNKFLNYNTGQYHSYCATVSGMVTNGVASPFSIRTIPSMYDMTSNGNDLFSNPIQINIVSSPLPQTITFCNGGPNNPVNRITNMANQIVNPGIYNAALIRDNNISRRQLYKILENVATPNNTLTSFKNSSVNNSIGQFATVDSLTTEFSNTGNISKLMQAQSLNSSVSSTTTVDGYQKQLNVLFVSYLTNNTLSTSEIGQLQSIAALCPYTDGTSIWEARTFLKLFDSTDYVNACEISTFPTTTSSRMAKLSVSETVDEQIKGQLIPNPNNGNFSIVINEDVQDLKAEVYDVNGKLVCSNVSANNNRIDILCSELTNGVYFVKLFVNSTYNETHRLIITK